MLSPFQVSRKRGKLFMPPEYPDRPLLPPFTEGTYPEMSAVFRVVLVASRFETDLASLLSDQLFDKTMIASPTKAADFVVYPDTVVEAFDAGLLFEGTALGFVVVPVL